MKKKTAMIGTALLLLTVGGVTALNVINPSWRENTIFATARDKQLAWLKEHEKENSNDRQRAAVIDSRWRDSAQRD